MISFFWIWHVQIEIVLGKSEKFDSLMTAPVSNETAPEELEASVEEKSTEAEADTQLKEWPSQQPPAYKRKNINHNT